jgi:hypothetical protein
MTSIVTITERLTIRQDDDFSKIYVLSNNGTPIDLTSCSVLAQIRQEDTVKGHLIYTFNSETSGCIIDVMAGKITIFLTQATALDLTWDNPAYYDVIITWSDGSTSCLAEGEAILEGGTTNPEDL